MSLELRVERFGEEHVEPYRRLSQVEYGDHAAVSQAVHLRWKFIENPQGPTTGVHLYRDGELVARMAALARQFMHGGKTWTAAHIVDFLVHPRERGMNSLLQLVMGLKQLSGYDFQLIMAPNPAGAAVWEKFVKMPGYFDLEAAVVPLRPAAVLESTGKLRSGKAGAVVDAPWRLTVGGAAKLGGAFGRMKTDGEWPESKELDELFANRAQDQVIGVRSADYLEWRYRRSPVFHYDVLFLRDRGRLSGYLVTRRNVYNGLDCLFIVDAFGRPELTPAAWRAASLRAIARASKGGAQMVMLLGNTEWGALEKISGMPFLKVPPRFLPRKTTVYAQWSGSAGFDIRRDNVYMALGDSDVI